MGGVLTRECRTKSNSGIVAGLEAPGSNRPKSEYMGAVCWL